MPPARPAQLGQRLSESELRVMRLVINGRSNIEISRELFISELTVKSHLGRIFRKLGARDRGHAGALCIATRQLHPREVEIIAMPSAVAF
ncbi:helix-turn-helix transcriptional regulator [Kitasatospora sp. NPDC048239]|uniref:helix-turn-helix domain-containing protein n=1 Tax=Kitasatospora sp. NPDC048239 TaxID=3364046 RepID=UPI0037167871